MGGYNNKSEKTAKLIEENKNAVKIAIEKSETKINLHFGLHLEEIIKVNW